jgi:hypothetical protein
MLTELQSQSPYVRGGVLPNATFLGHSVRAYLSTCGKRLISQTPCGSSSGSAIGVAAGFSPISIGSETDGSLTQPACRAGLYALKPTVASVPNTGAMGLSPFFDSHGGMAKTVNDLAHMTGILMGGKDFQPFLKGSWTGFSAGMVDPAAWEPAAFVVEPVEEFRQQTVSLSLLPQRMLLKGLYQRKEMSAALDKIEAAGPASFETCRWSPLRTWRKGLAQTSTTCCVSARSTPFKL